MAESAFITNPYSNYGLKGYTDYTTIDPSATMKNQIDQLNVDSLRIANNNSALSNTGLDPSKFGQSYLDNMSVGSDGKLYNSGITEQTNKAIAESNVMAGSTQQNADLLNKDTEWGVKEWGTAGSLGLGAGQLGLGLASYFENKKTADAQRKLLGQQYDSNKEFIADRRANKEALSKLKIN